MSLNVFTSKVKKMLLDNHPEKKTFKTFLSELLQFDSAFSQNIKTQSLLLHLLGFCRKQQLKRSESKPQHPIKADTEIRQHQT